MKRERETAFFIASGWKQCLPQMQQDVEEWLDR
jgi:hypothetical protein